MTDSQAIRNLIRSKGLKLKFVADSLGLSYYAFQQKIDNRREFKTSEITSLCELLDIKTLSEKEKIFFCQESRLIIYIKCCDVATGMRSYAGMH